VIPSAYPANSHPEDGIEFDFQFTNLLTHVRGFPVISGRIKSFDLNAYLNLRDEKDCPLPPTEERPRAPPTDQPFLPLSIVSPRIGFGAPSPAPFQAIV